MRIISFSATFEEETSDANREDADKGRNEGKRKLESGEEKRNQDDKRRILQLLATEKKHLDKFPEGCLHGPSRHDLNRILSALELSMRCRMQKRVCIT